MVEFPTAHQITGFIRGIAGAETVGNVPVQRVPELRINELKVQPPAPPPPGALRAYQVGEERPEPEPLPEAPKPICETELRSTLAQAVLALNFACDNEARAAATHARSLKHVEHCQERLAEFATVEEEAAAEVLAGLQDERRHRVEVSDAMRQRMALRDRARSDLAATTRASVVLSEALADARQDVVTAEQAANAAAVAVVALKAEELALRIVTAEAEAAALRETLAGFNSISPRSYPPTVRQVYGDGQRFMRPVDGAGWVAARQALLADPAAQVEVT